MTMIRIAAALVALSAGLLAFMPDAWTAADPLQLMAKRAPELRGISRWYNSAPLTMQALRGKVVLVEFWTRECVNCIQALPHTKALYDEYSKDGLVVIGVHTPEYEEEHDRAALQRALDRYQIDWPVAVDDSYEVWKAYDNHYWPAIYLIDKNGRVVYHHFGAGDDEETERRIRQLLGMS